MRQVQIKQLNNHNMIV